MKGVIYRIYDNTNGNIYYGSTIQSLSNRIAGHRSIYKRWLKGDKRHSCKSFEIIKNGDYDYNIVEEIDCENKYELHNRERYYIDLFRSTLNKVLPGRTNKEYRDDNKEQIKEKKKKYREANKEKYKENCTKNSKKYREANKEKEKEKAKKYRENNRDYFREKAKEYYDNNKDKLSEYYKKKVICDHCGCEINKNNLPRHQKTKKCLKSQENNITR